MYLSSGDNALLVYSRGAPVQDSLYLTFNINSSIDKPISVSSKIEMLINQITKIDMDIVNADSKIDIVTNQNTHLDIEATLP